ncbi:MAG: histidinol-phosphate transaminase [Verrucomicrobia bacterium]|nr:histidinol-phosphate transaminase [Verrucomicrobiota bacterium]MCG2678794.1 histidinol-phosphate transaminase [Kiritimatiellia bacterium]MBU4246992.1 histidinol-phosphate transaminase [Verrucomicrobiota bacterium]MBU4291865.1 histidinol-phosphate transaminase [Verrucomicrobiota bacterium]MBU4427830.1 histidinol-phosphate transaminase [Verrucomicrobiota bacterium]
MKTIAHSWIMELGMYERGKPLEEVARELGFESADAIIKLASNENALGPSPRAMRAMKRAASQMHRYPDGSAHYLRQALAAKLNVSPDQILPANGSNEIIEFIGHTFLGPGTEMIMADRGFAIYHLVAALCRSRSILVPMKDYTHDLDAMAAAITPQTRVVFIANPNNPTGTMVDGPALDRFMARAPDHLVVCIDEAYIELLPPKLQPDTLRYVREGRKVILLRTFSKTYGLAGLRVGYAVASEEGIGLLNRVRQPFNVNAMALVAAQAALADEAFVRKTRKMVREGLAYFEERLAAWGVPYVPSVVNFMLVDVGEGRTIFQALQKEKVIVRPMNGYGLPRHVRITVGTREENEHCLRGLAKVLGKPRL